MFPILIALLAVSSLWSLEEEASFSPGLSREDTFPIVNLEGEPNAIVAGCVNVISGDYFEIQRDLMLKGGEPLVLERSYSSSDTSKGTLCNGWQFNLQGTIKLSPWAAGFIHKGPFGSELLFAPLEQKEARIHALNFKKGITNNAKASISGRTNLRNHLLKQDFPSKRQCMLVRGDASFSIFKKDDHHTFKLTVDRKPSGIEQHFSYDPEGRLSRVLMLGRTHKELQSLAFDYPQKNIRSHLEVQANDGRKVQYFFTKYKHNGDRASYVRKVFRPDAPQEEYAYENISDNDHVHRRLVEKRVGDHIKQISYYKKQKYGSFKVKKDSPQLGRVQCLLSPIGTDATPIVSHEFIYEFPKKNSKSGLCHVFNAHKAHTIYFWDEDQRLIGIEKRNHQDTPYTSEQLFWGKDVQAGNLSSRLLASPEEALFCKTYDYDEAGNVTKEVFYGHVSGKNPAQVVVDAAGRPVETGCDRHEKSYTYSQDGRNLLLTETEGSRGAVYRYYDDTDLVAVKYIVSHGQIVERHCYAYDKNAALVSEIIDNGTREDPQDLENITFRKLRLLKPRQEFPFGVPDSIEEYYQNPSTGELSLLKYLVNSYSTEGHLIRQDYYDANREYRYSLHWEYNYLGQVTKEINALGHVIERQYDGYGNLIIEKGPDHSHYKGYVYDFSNRLIRVDEVYPDRALHTHYRYDLLGRKIASIDPYGHETRYEYDEFDRLVRTVYPPVLNEKDELVHPETRFAYDYLGNRTVTTDAKGYSTITHYTVKGKPHTVVYPDGTMEKYTYYLHGPVESYTDRNGCVRKYSIDYKDRVVRTDFYTPDGVLKSTTSATYDAFHLLSETDAMGYTTHYTYDVFGRKKQVIAHGSVETYSYDSLGRIIEKSVSYGPQPEDVIINRYIYDLLDRVIEETTEDYFGNISRRVKRAYDVEDRVILETTFNENGENRIETHYDSMGTPVEIIDALGNVTKTHRRFDYRNDLGQLVPYLEVIDVLGNAEITIRDALGRTAEVTRKNAAGAVTQQQAFRYDLNGNLSKTIERVHGLEKPYSICHFRTYDAMNRLSCLIEAQGMPEQLTTCYSYDDFGRLQTVIKPSGVELHRTYTLDGVLERFSASDGSFAYRYAYDLNDQIVAVHDEAINQMTSLIYKENRLVEEKQGTGHTIKYEYDWLGRVKKIVLPDDSSVGYLYQGPLLREIARYSSDAQLSYKHTYDRFDESGRCLEQTFLRAAGKIMHAYDKKGRLEKIASKHTVEKATNFDAADQLLHREVKKQDKTVAYDYAYDDLYQLTCERGEGSHTYTYDSTYNRVEKNGVSFKYNALNQIQEVGYLYDLDGRLVQTPTAKYTYDALDRLVAVTKDRVTTTYTYDAFHRRLAKNATIYLYDGNREIGAMVDGRFVELRVLPPKQPDIGTAVAFEIRGQVYAPVHDFFGNVVALLDDKGRLAASYSYSAFGEGIVASFCPWRFASKRYDAESDLSYFGRRYYDPVLGRWLTPDPIGYEDGSNLYAYVHNNPCFYSDPEGKFAFVIPVLAVAFGSGEAVAAFITLEALGNVLLTAVCAYGVYQVNKKYDAYLDSLYMEMESQSDGKFTGGKTEETTQEQEDTKTKPQKKPLRQRFHPDENAEGDHTVIRRDEKTGKITNYETYRPQTNSRDPKPWESVKRFDDTIKPHGHHNKCTGEEIWTPHVHDPSTPGKLRHAETWEIPTKRG